MEIQSTAHSIRTSSSTSRPIRWSSRTSQRSRADLSTRHAYRIPGHARRPLGHCRPSTAACARARPALGRLRGAEKRRLLPLDHQPLQKASERLHAQSHEPRQSSRSPNAIREENEMRANRKPRTSSTAICRGHRRHGDREHLSRDGEVIARLHAATLRRRKGDAAAKRRSGMGGDEPTRAACPEAGRRNHAQRNRELSSSKRSTRQADPETIVPTRPSRADSFEFVRPASRPPHSTASYTRSAATFAIQAGAARGLRRHRRLGTTSADACWKGAPALVAATAMVFQAFGNTPARRT